MGIGISSQYTVKGRNPFDSKQKVNNLNDLFSDNTWVFEGSNIAYNGMFVVVSTDATISNRGLYMLLDQTVVNNFTTPDYKTAGNWHKVASLDELANYATNGDLSAIAQRVTALEESSSDSIGIDSFDITYFKLNDQQKITLNNILSEYVEGTDYASNPAIPTVGFVTSIVEGKIDAAHKVTSTQRRYKVITDGAPDFANPPSFDSMDDFGTATPNIVQGNWMWSATRLTYENEGTITSYGLSYVGKDGAPGTNGSDGTDGTNGLDGKTPYIGENGNWYIGTEDTHVKAQGPNFITQVGNKVIDEEFLKAGKLNIFAPQSQTLFTAEGSTAYAPSATLNSSMYVSIYSDANNNKFVYAPLIIDDGILE